MWEEPHRRVAAFAFDLHDSDLPLQPAFPILIQNLTHWLLPAVNRSLAVQPGAAIAVPILTEADAAWVETPSGRRTQVAPPFPARPFTVEEVGLYRIINETPEGMKTGYLVANLFAPVESAIGPSVLPPLETQQGREEGTDRIPWELGPVAGADRRDRPGSGVVRVQPWVLASDSPWRYYSCCPYWEACSTCGVGLRGVGRVFAATSFWRLDCCCSAFSFWRLRRPAWRHTVNRQAVVFVADLSASADQQRAWVEEFVRQAMEARGRDDRAGVVAIGRDSLVEWPVTGDGRVQGVPVRGPNRQYQPR